MKGFTTILLIVWALAGGVVPVHAANVAGVRSYRAPDYTRLVFDLDAPLQYELNQQNGSAQIVIDLKASSYQGKFTGLSLENTPIANIASSVLEGGDLRVVLELRNKVDPRSFTLGKNDQYGDRLVVDLYDVEPAETLAKNTPPASKAISYADPIAAIAASVDNSGKRDIVIAVSAGHGGDDPGAIGVKKLQEKNVTLALARTTAEIINRLPGYKAVMIRDADYYIGLRQKVVMAHKHNADLFVEIHADAAENKNAQGATIYALSQGGATSEQARMLADKENNTDLIGGIGNVSLDDKDAVLAKVLLDLSMTASVATSLEIGKQLIDSVGDVTKMRRRNVEQAGFVVLKSADIPSLLVESGYITNASDAAALDSPQWRQKFAAALVQGITHWFEQRPPRGTLVAWQQQHGKSGAVVSSYTVQRGDSLSAIAQRFHVSMGELQAANSMKKDSVQIGQVLKIPSKAANTEANYKNHKIIEGETLSAIAFGYEVTLESLRETNELKSDTIRPGQILKIPTT